VKTESETKKVAGEIMEAEAKKTGIPKAAF